MPGLDLVEDQQRADRVAGLAGGAQHLVGDRRGRRSRPGSARSAPRRCRRRPPPASASASSRGDRAKPGTSGANGACLASCGVAESAPSVRPWKARSRTTISRPSTPRRARAAGELDRASFASAPELQKKTRPPSETRRAARPAASPARCRRGSTTCIERRRPARATASTTAGWQWPSVVDARCPLSRSRYSLPVGVPERARPRRARTRPGAARRCGIDVARRRAPGGRSSAHRAGSIFVPMPASVKSSSSRRCGRAAVDDVGRLLTPPWIASTQAASFGRMPPSIAGSAASTSSTVGLARSASPGRRGPRSQPSTSVRKIAL